MICKHCFSYGLFTLIGGKPVTSVTCQVSSEEEGSAASPEEDVQELEQPLQFNSPTLTKWFESIVETHLQTERTYLCRPAVSGSLIPMEDHTLGVSRVVYGSDPAVDVKTWPDNILVTPPRCDSEPTPFPQMIYKDGDTYHAITPTLDFYHEVREDEVGDPGSPNTKLQMLRTPRPKY